MDIAWTKENIGLRDFARTTTGGGLTRERSSQKSDQIFRKLALVTDSKIRDLLGTVDRMPPEAQERSRPKCSYGCAYCCYQWVRCVVPEVLVVSRHLQENLTEDQMSALMDALVVYRREHEKLAAGELSAIACPLLVDNLCSVYEVRPFICRGCNSTNVDACKQGMEDPHSGVMIPVIMPIMTAAAAVRVGMRAGLADASLQPSEVVFGLALQTSLLVPDAAERYFSGEDVFHGDVPKA